ncbi:MAG: hypothetical protein H0X66_08235 [Verrucomicrobia bacterium]|nr:hypothetical protein [Verrucomicrobiota bacterium]
MQPDVMAKFKFVLLFAFLLAVLGSANAGTYTLSDGQTITGEPVSFDSSGVILRLSGGGFSPRTPWGKFTQESLKDLQSEAKNPQEADIITPFLEETALEEAQQQQINIKPPPRMERPTGNTGLSALFKSSLGLFLFLVVYGGNLYAAYEIARFKNLPIPLVCGVSAVAPFLAPIVFLMVPGRLDYVDQQSADQLIEEANARAQAQAAAEEPPLEHHGGEEGHAPAHHGEHKPAMHFTLPSTPVSAPAPAQPAVTFQKGEFTFNRRFFETKMPGFFRVVPSEAEKDMVLVVRAMRGEFIARRVSKITQTEIHLETFKDHATAEEIVPFTEIQEVSIQHKDSV